MNEPKTREKFKTLASKRVSNAGRMITNIGNLSNKSNYSYEEKDVKKIFGYLKRKLKEAEDRFTQNGSKGSDEFVL
jgi:hypothetical protein